MSLLNKTTQPIYDGGESEDERLEAIFTNLLETYGHGVTTMSNLNSTIGLNLNVSEEQYFEALLVNSTLIDSSQPSGSNYYTIKLSNDGFLELRKHGSYKQYKLSSLSTQEVGKLILSKLKEGSFIPVSDILSEIGIDPDLADVYESLLSSKGFIQCSKQGCILKPAGKAFLHGISDENFQVSKESSDSNYHEEVSLKVDEIIEYLKKAGVEREILFEEMQELKELSKILSKKNWKQIVLGKLGDIAIDKAVDAGVLNFVYNSLVGEGRLLPF